MLLFVGLGNPGSKYAGHRHNVGFMAVDHVVRRHNFGPEKSKFQSLAHEGRIGSEKVIVLKPQTYMNESGRAVNEAMRFYKLTPDDVFVFYDELDLAFAKLKMKTGGGAAGHNGIRSITAHIGAEFHRIRLGIGHPGDRSRVTGHVLGDFAKAEQAPLDDLLSAIANESEWLVKSDFPRFQTEVAKRLAPAKPKAKAPQQNNANPPKPHAKQATKRPANSPAEGPLADALRVLKGDK